MTLRHWVGDWADVPMAPAQQRAVGALGQSLERLQPRKLDRTRSSVSVLEDDEEDRSDAGICVTIEYETEPEATVELDIWPDQAVVHWLGQTESMRDYCGGDPEADWPVFAAEVVAAILSGHRGVEDTYWRGRWRRTRLLDGRDPAKPARERTTVGGLTLWWLVLTLPGTKVERRYLDFAVQEPN